MATWRALGPVKLSYHVKTRARKQVRQFNCASLLLRLLLVLFAALAAIGCQGLSVATPTTTIVSPTPLPTPPPPTPTPPPPVPTPVEMAVQSYTNPTLGISLSYPGDWLFRETEMGVVFGASQQVIAGGELTADAGLALYIEPWPDATPESAEELCVSQASLMASEEMELGAAQPRDIGEQNASVITLQGVPSLSETEVRGFVAVAVWEGWAYTFVGLSAADEWPTYGDILQKMLDGVQFMRREQPEYTPDIWEPDNSLAAANEIELASSQNHDLHNHGDRDFLSFRATRGHVYTIETANLGEDIDTEIFLYDDEGNLLAQDDDGRHLEEAWASRLIWTAEKTNTLCLMVHDAGDDHAGPGTLYNIRIWEEVHFVEDESEPDDSLDLATRLEAGIPQPHNLHFPGDHDWIRFEARAGNVYIIETFDLGPGVDTVLHLFSEEGNELVEDDNGRDDDEPLASRVEWTARRNVLLYIMVHDLDDNDAGPGTEYWVRLSETWP